MSAVFTTPALAKHLGISYRELDHWVTQGWIASTTLNGGEDRRNPGTGKVRVWVGREVSVARIFANLVHAGMKPRFAGRIAEGLVDGEVVELATGIELHATDDLEAASEATS